MSNKNANDKKGLIATVFAIILIGITVAIVVLLLNRNQDTSDQDTSDQNTFDQNTFEYEGWIDCMPPLSSSEEDLCRRAKDANYPYIAY
ncbi:hypothetical protein IJI29_03450 [Candidatus Saccharibacteria bacterium]|nr:hypothetical protein [Candidatus Saccharibacteria bacterium]